MKNSDKSFYNFKRRHRLEWCCVAVFITIIVTSSIMDLTNCQFPQWALQQTSDNGIYQTLFSGLASMVGIVMAIIALLMGVVSTKIYGISLTRYVMTLKPIKPLQHNWVVVEVIVLTALTWTFVAWGKNNLAISLFVTTITLLIYLAVEVMKVMRSSQNLEAEIREYILDSKDFNHTINLFTELKKNISAGDILAFQRDIEFAKELIQGITINALPHEKIFKIRDLLISIIHIANKSQFSKVSEILDLLISAVNVATSIKLKPIPTSIIDDIEAYELLGRASHQSLVGATGELLLFYWHKAFLANKAMPVNSNMNDISVATHIYHSLIKGQSERNEKVLTNLLADTLSFLESDEIDKEIAEQNYLNFSLTLFATRDQYLLNVLFGFDGRKAGLLTPICDKYGYFNFSKVNVFLILYTYYLAYRESNQIVKQDEKDFCANLLSKAGKCFWISLHQKYNRYSPSLFDDLRGSYRWFYVKLNRNERSSEYSYGITSVKAMISGCVTLDFFAFGLAHFLVNTEMIECGLKAILYDDEKKVGRTSFLAFERYVLSDALEDYKAFCSVMKGFNESNIDDEYARLKTAAINLYRDERLSEARIYNEEFSPNKDEYEKNMTGVIQKVVNQFCLQFSSYTDEDELHYIPYHISEISLPLHNGALPLSENELSSLLSRSLNAFILHRIRKMLKLYPMKVTDVSVDAFMQSISGIDVDTIIGHEMFRYNDENYQAYTDLKSNCNIIEVYGGNANINAALNSKLIKVSIINARVEICPPNNDYISHALEENTVMTINGYSIELDNSTAKEYLINSRRIISVRMDIAITCLKDVIGGGIEFEQHSN